jgi:fatty acid desaturase
LIPALEVVFLMAAIVAFPSQPLSAVLLVALASLALCFALHMSYHEVAHRSGKWCASRQLVTGLLLTPLLGVAFHGYRISHWNHHRYNNGLEDFTTTWKNENGHPAPKNIFVYCFSWPEVFVYGPQLFRKSVNDGDASHRELWWCRAESLFLVSWIAFLYWLSPAALFLYLELIYIGWVLVSLHNFGQHLPMNHESPLRTTSYNAAWYNRAFFNNGLHYEHHRRPAVPIAALQPESDSEPVTVPHLLAAFVRRVE